MSIRQHAIILHEKGPSMERKPLFEAKNISKSFAGTQALKDISIEIYGGEIVGLIGENGAGKSTLLKIIQGVVKPNCGTMLLRDRKYAPQNPKDANEMGAGMVFQEQSLIVNLTVGQNIFFSREKEFSRCKLVNWNKVYKETATVLEELNLSYIKPHVKVFELDFADRQMVEIARVINNARRNAQESSLILLDEPTSVLNEAECTQLFEEIYKLRDDGNAVVFISHRLDEVLKVSDRIYVFKNGMNVAELINDELDQNRLYELMVGRESNQEYYHVDKQAQYAGEVVLEAKSLGLFGRFKDVSFQLHKGEVLGICGVVGSGKEAVCACITGNEIPTSGKILRNGKELKLKMPTDALKNGILSVPKWRNEEGVLETLSVRENICLSNLDKVKGRILLSRAKRKALTDAWIQKLRIKCSDPNEEVRQLSGGNVQKVVFARVLSSGAEILVLNHPTRGVDIGAKEEIYALIREITQEGVSIVLLSDTLEECIGLANNIIVMKDGGVSHVFAADPLSKPTQSQIVKYMV